MESNSGQLYAGSGRSVRMLPDPFRYARFRGINVVEAILVLKSLGRPMHGDERDHNTDQKSNPTYDTEKGECGMHGDTLPERERLDYSSLYVNQMGTSGSQFYIVFPRVDERSRTRIRRHMARI